MNHDTVYNRLRELSWRRPLTEIEHAELRAWLAAHPEAHAEWDAEMELSRVLDQLPAAPVPSNFTSRVLQAVEREAAEPTRRSGFWRAWHWRVLLPRMAAVAVVAGLSLLGYHRYEVNRRAEGLRVIATVPELANPELLEDFEAIRRLGSTPQPDEELLALLKLR